MILPKSLAAVARTSSVASSAVRRVALATPRLAPRARVASPRQQDRQPARARLETQVFRTRAAALYASRRNQAVPRTASPPPARAMSRPPAPRPPPRPAPRPPPRPPWPPPWPPSISPSRASLDRCACDRPTQRVIVESRRSPTPVVRPHRSEFFSREARIS